MKCFFPALAAFLGLSICAASAGAAPLTKLERQRLVAHLEMTQSWMLDEVSQLSPEQLRTDDDLRAHVVKGEGTDVYQWLLGITAHTQRRILQIREIKSDPKFPKS